MAINKKGEQSIVFKNNVCIISNAAVVGAMEAKGPYRDFFDMTANDALFGEKSFELAERKMLREAVTAAIYKAGMTETDLDAFIGGDLLNQIISAGYTARDMRIPFLGVYGACSTMAESMLVGSMMIDGGFADKVVAATGSHFATAERQYRGPLELGTPKTPTSQNTVTAAGAAIIAESGSNIFIKSATIGHSVDFGIKDAGNMGAAMAPAAAETLLSHFEDTGRDENYYDLILTGDLGSFGSDLFIEMVEECGHRIVDKHMDCGVMIYRGMNKIECGGSGCGCGAAIFNGYIIEQLKKGELNKVLFIATGALMSPTIIQQGESITSIAHAVGVERGN